MRSRVIYLSVGHVRELCKNGRTDRDAVYGLTPVGPRNHVLDGVEITPRDGAILGVVRPAEKHCESLMCCTQQRIKNGNWRDYGSQIQCSRLVDVTLHYLREKFAPCDAAFCQNSLSTCFGLLSLYALGLHFRRAGICLFCVDQTVI